MPMTAGPAEFYDAYLFDMDGTIYLGDELLPGARRVIETLQRAGRPVVFLSNNPTKDPENYRRKLEGMGIRVEVSAIKNTVVVMTTWLRTHHPDAVVFPLAEAALIDAFREAGIAMSEDPERIDIVVASYDRTFDYRKLQIAFDAIWYHKRAFLVATNPDRFCPYPKGRGEPDCAAIVAAIEACTSTRCQINVGKPHPLMVQTALEGLDVDPSRCLMVGDRLATDIRMAVDAGMDSALVLTGDSTRDDVADVDEGYRPTYVLDHIDELLPPAAGDGQGVTR